MNVIYTSFKKSKKRKPTAAQRELDESWVKLMKQYEPKKPIPKKSDAFSYSLGTTARRETPNIPSLPFTGGPCTKKEQQMYTGTAMKGIGTLHKSNAVPIFTDEEAIDIAKMRR